MPKGPKDGHEAAKEEYKARQEARRRLPPVSWLLRAHMWRRVRPARRRILSAWEKIVLGFAAGWGGIAQLRHPLDDDTEIPEVDALEEPDTNWPHQKIQFRVTMKLREMLSIAVRNAVLSVLTLTLYRFWARTRVRRYIWSRISFLDEPLEYTGSSFELLLGFFQILLVLVIPLVGVSIWMQLFVEPDSPLSIPYGIAVYLGLGFLYGVARYRAQRFRLSRTLWRGIRFGLKGSWVSYGVRTLLFVYLSFATFLWAYPLQRFVLIRQMLRNMTLGDRQFQFEGDPTVLYPSFAIGWFASLFGLIVAYVASAAILLDLFGENLLFRQFPILDGSLSLTGEDFFTIAILTFVVTSVTGLVLAFTMSWYRAKELRYFAACLRLDGMRFKLRASGLAFLRLSVGNALIIIFTLGLGLPLAQMRTFKFVFKRLRAEGQIDVESIAQSDAPYPWVGEGLAEFFDIGAV